MISVLLHLVAGLHIQGTLTRLNLVWDRRCNPVELPHRSLSVCEICRWPWQAKNTSECVSKFGCNEESSTAMVIRQATKKIFPRDRLSRADYVFSFILVTICYALFFHRDMWGVGWDSLNYLFGSPWEFYDNCKRIRGEGQTMRGTPYPPTIYVFFALWLSPFKLFGAITDPLALPLHYTYWLKALTTLVYAASGVVFYRVALEFSPNRQWAKYATAAWLTAPLALFSQLIFSQYDIFYVLLALAGFFLFLRDRLFLASLCFGLAITFKYFPALAYLPLLLFFEKRLGRLAVNVLIFIVPMLLVELMYGQSAAYVEGVKNHFAVDRVYAAFVKWDFIKIYLLFASFSILCGLAYFMDLTGEARTRTAAYLWLVASILPFLFIFWHPQWVISCAPAVTLTSVLSTKRAKFMLLDLVGMGLFVATVSLIFQHNVDADMFRSGWLGLEFGDSYLMAELFSWFGRHSVGVFLSGFWGYLVLQIVLKYELLLSGSTTPPQNVDYGEVRQRLYIGMLIFLLPAWIVIYIDLMRGESVVSNMKMDRNLGELWGSRAFEQTFVASGKAMTRVSIFVSTFDRQNTGDVALEIFDADGKSLAYVEKSVVPFQDYGWEDFTFDPVSLEVNGRYKMSLTARAAAAGNAITWWAAADNSYKDGAAIVDGSTTELDFAFRISFTK